MAVKGETMTIGIGKNRLIDARKLFPAADTKGAQIFSGWQNEIIRVGRRRTIGEERIIAIKMIFLNIVNQDAASKIVIKVEELFEAK